MMNKMNRWSVKFNLFDINYCPYCGNKVKVKKVWYEGDDLHYRGYKHILKCKNCKKTLAIK